MTDGLTGSEAALLGFVNCSFIVLLLAASEPGNQSLTRRRGERGERERWAGGGGAAGGGGVSAPRTAPASGLWAAGRNSWTRLHTASLRSTDRAEPAPRDPRENRLSVFLLLLLRADCCVLWPRRGLQPRLTAAPLRLPSAGSSSCCWRPRCCGVFGRAGRRSKVHFFFALIIFGVVHLRVTCACARRRSLPGFVCRLGSACSSGMQKLCSSFRALL